ncbi:MAG: spore coat protein CotJB [Clostridiales bacterium]|nr:spore coat protein CotJB [Clostridiales bacterium]
MENRIDRAGDERTPAMVYCQEQDISRIFDAHRALRNGTLYPDLYKPMNEACPRAGGAGATDKQAQEFAAWELRLYLNTHPGDRRALEAYRSYCAMISGPGYACTFAAQPEGRADTWRWVDDPWPWEYEDCREGRGQAGEEERCHVCV